MAADESIVVFLPNWVGDVVMATPVLRALRAARPGANIAWLGRPAALAVLAGSSWADETIAEPPGGTRLGRILKTAKELRRRRYDLAVLLPNSFAAALAARLGRARRRLGYARDARGWLLTHKRQPLRKDGRFVPVPQIGCYADLLAEIGLDVPDRRMELPVTDAHEREADELLAGAGRDENRPLVVLNPGGAFGPSKMWEPGKYARLADRLAELAGAQTVLNVAPSEARVARWVRQEMATEPLVDFGRRENSLPLLRSVLKRADLLVTNDTGARHVAAAFGVGIVTVFGSTDPVWAEIDYPRERQVRIDLPCSPCQQKICPQPAGPLYQKCTRQIPVERVLEPALELLAARADGRETA